MKITLSTSEIISRLLNDPYRSFSHDACIALADYFHEMEQLSGEEIEFDLVAIRCGWTEYESAQQIADNYSNTFIYSSKSHNPLANQVELFLDAHTQYIKFGKGRYLVAQF